MYPRLIIIIIEVSLIITPIHPTELKSIARKMDVVIKTVIPEEVPDIRVAINAGISDMSSFKNGAAGIIKGILIKKAVISDIIVNTIFCERTFIFELNMCPHHLIYEHNS